MKKTLIIHPHEISKKWIDKMADHGADIFGIHPVGGVRAHETLEQLICNIQTPKFRKLIDYAKKKGLEIEYQFHAASYLIPRELFKTNPEYFRMDSDGNRTESYNFCASNPEALSLAAKRAAKLASMLYGSRNFYYFWLDDAKDIGCKCEKCRKYSDSDQQLIILNEILKELKKENPDTCLAYLAYYGTLTPPEKIKPDEGIFVQYAPIERDMKIRVRDGAPESIENLHRLIEYFGAKEATVLEYWLDNSLFSNWKPDNIQKLNPDNDLIRDDIEFYHSLGFDNIQTFACFLGEEYEKLYGEADISGFSEKLY